MIEQLTVIGLGLIGSSVARAAKAYGLASRVVAYDISTEVQRRVNELGFVDLVTPSLSEAVRQADLTIICIPVGATAEVARELKVHLKPDSIVSDVGSVKSVVTDALIAELYPRVHVVPAHPVAGTEYSGPDAGFASLFQNRWCIVTPPEGTELDAIEVVKSFWTGCGANVETMTPKHHDLVLAITSHVPHLIAYNIVGTAADLEEVTQSEVIKFSAGGFRDFTRIAASDPTMWRDIFLHNKEAVLEMLGRFNEDLLALQRMIRWGDGQGLFELFTRTRAIRRSIIAQGQETAAPDFGRVQSEKGR
jgi:cyclohexadieny/prephenate dehydrogenase